jgi:hypothetical protein
MTIITVYGETSPDAYRITGDPTLYSIDFPVSWALKNTTTYSTNDYIKCYNETLFNRVYKTITMDNDLDAYYYKGTQYTTTVPLKWVLHDW